MDETNADKDKRYADDSDDHGMRQRRSAKTCDVDVENAIAASDDDDDDGTVEIPKDSFSMFYAAEHWIDHILPTGVFILQVLILILISANLLQENENPQSNWLSVPVDVPPTVTISQYIACFVSVFTADDLVSGMLFTRTRIVVLDDNNNNSSKKGNCLPSNSLCKHKWGVSNSMRIVEGFLVIAVSFVFIVQSSTVIDLFLNFAGVTFVGTLDDTSFALAINGFLGARANRLAQRVWDLRARDDSRGYRVGKIDIGRYFLFAGITICMWVGLSVVVIQQDASQFACRRVAIEVGDTKYAWARHYSGAFSQAVDGYGRAYQRTVYTKEEGANMTIEYSKWRMRWIVYFEDNSFSLMSERTRTFDIAEVGEFRFWTGEASDAEIKCIDCSSKMKGGVESCSFRGECDPDTRKCRCSEGYFGSRCQHKGPCTEVIMHEPFKGSKSTSGNAYRNRAYPKSFDLMYVSKDKPAMWLDHPLYGQRQTSRYMFYDGGHWNVIQLEPNSDITNIYDYLVNEVTHEDVLYVSEPSNSGSPTHLSFRAKLASIENNWDDDTYEGSKSIGRLGGKEFHFSCADCISHDHGGDHGLDGVAYCTGSDGKINHTMCEAKKSDLHGNINRCSCLPGFMGPLCHIRPAEGQILLHMDKDGSGFCPVCGGDVNDWSFWELDGIHKTCLPFPKEPLTFQQPNNVTFTRQLGLNLNKNHFSVFVSGDSAVGGNDLCRPGDGIKEIYSLMRNSSTEQIHHDYAIQLSNNISYFGEVVDPTGVECKTKTNVDDKVCDAFGPLTWAWIQLDMKVTPFNTTRPTNHKLNVTPIDNSIGDDSLKSSFGGEIAAFGNTTLIAADKNVHVVEDYFSTSHSNPTKTISSPPESTSPSGAPSSLQLYYPNWMKGHCDNDLETIKVIIGAKSYETAEECCQNDFSWQLEECLAKSP